LTEKLDAYGTVLFVIFEQIKSLLTMKKSLFTVLSIVISMSAFSQMRSQGIPTNSISKSTKNVVNVNSQSNQKIHDWYQLENHSFDSQALVTTKALCIDTLLFEDFQSETISATWINQDIDGLNDANGRPQNWFPFQDLQTTTPGDTNYVAASSSWLSPAGTSNNWLILDAVNPCIDTKLNWWSAPFEGPAFMDGYKVMVSTTGTNIGDFTTTIFTAAESVNGTATPSAGAVHTNYNGNNGVLQEWTVDLGAYDNQTIYIAFVHDSNDDNLIMIDNIFVGIVPQYDLAVVGTDQTPPYVSTPLTQAQGLTFSGEVALGGGTDVTQPTLTFEIFQNATSVFTNSVSQVTQIAGATDTYTASAAFTPAASDNYMVTYTASAVETDPAGFNNSDTTYFVVSDSVYARDNGTYDGSLSIGAGSAGFLGNMYDVVAADEITSITFVLTAPLVGDTIVGQVYSMLGGVPDQIIASTDTLFVTSALEAEYTLPIIGGSVNLVPGQYVVGLLESISSSVTLATNTEYYVPGTSWVYFNSAWDNNEAYNFFNTYVARANFGTVCIDPTSAFSNVITDLSVNFTDASTGINVQAWFWNFGDGNTSTQQNPSHTYAGSGTYDVCLTVTDDCGSNVSCTSIDVTALGIEENAFADVSIFPMPANDYVVVGNLKENQQYTIELLNSIGQVINVYSIAESTELKMELSDVAHGVYQIRISSNNQMGVKPVLIVRK
jgi:PKD repeat protein